MSYSYEIERSYVFTDEGQRHFLHIRDLANRLLSEAGVVMCDKLLVLGPVSAATDWEMLACVDRLVELGELIEVLNPLSRAGQHRLFVKPLR